MRYALLAIGLLVLAGCTTAIADVKTDGMLEEDVTIGGTVDNTIKIGGLSGFTLTDDTASIPVASDALPVEGDTVRVRGTVKRAPLLGYYVDAERVS